MGNSLPLPTLPCTYLDQEAKLVATAGAKKRRRRKKQQPAKNTVRPAPSHVVVPVDTPDDGDGGEEEDIKKSWLGCRVEPAGADRVRVKVVMTRKDAAELMARLEERGAVERKASMGELNTGLGGGSGSGSGNGSGVMASPCRDAWRPRLASIPEK